MIDAHPVRAVYGVTVKRWRLYISYEGECIEGNARLSRAAKASAALLAYREFLARPMYHLAAKQHYRSMGIAYNSTGGKALFLED